MCGWQDAQIQLSSQRCRDVLCRDSIVPASVTHRLENDLIRHVFIYDAQPWRSTEWFSERLTSKQTLGVTRLEITWWSSDYHVF